MQSETTRKWGFIDTSGKEVIAPIYDSNAYFSEGLAFVELNGKKMFIDKTGKVIREADYRSVGTFVDGIAPAMRGEVEFMQSFYIDKEGNEYY